MFPALTRVSLITFLYLTILTIAPAAAQEATPFPRIGDLPGTAAGCNELLVNGGFESPSLGWQPLTPGLPSELDHDYVSAPVVAGAHAMRIGIVEGENTAITGGIYQTVNLPSQASPIVLSFRYQPRHESNPSSDLQFLDIVDEITGERITRLWAQLAHRDIYLFLQYDLTFLAGRSIRVQFGVSNDGAGGRTALYLDEVSLQSCPTTPGPTPTGPTPTPTPSPTLGMGTPTPTPIVIEINTPTPTFVSALPTATPTQVDAPPFPTLTPTLPPTPILSPTPLPAGCISNIIINGGFEEAMDVGYGWILGDDPVPPQLTGDAAYEGLRALRLGNAPGPGTRNVETYSSVRQLITVPHTALTARLHWAHQSFTQAPPDQATGPGRDRQDLVLLTPDLVTIDVPYRRLRNDAVWQVESVDLTPYIGQTFFIYFNAFDDGDGLRTWMNLDAVNLEVCFSVPPPTPTFTSIPMTSTPTPIATGDAIERSVPLDVVTEEMGRALAIDTPEPEPRAADDNPPLSLGSIVGFLLSNWLWVLSLGIVAWLVWRFILH